MTKRLKDREVANRPYGRITWEQYLFLNPMAKELHDWWMNEKPEMYNEMADEGSLLPELKKRGDLYNRQVIMYMRQGLQEFEAKELVRADFQT